MSYVNSYVILTAVTINLAVMVSNFETASKRYKNPVLPCTFKEVLTKTTFESGV